MATAHWKDIGPVELTYKGTALPDTAAGFRYRINLETAQSFRDKQGTQPVDEIVTGTPIDCEADLGIETLEQLAALIPGAVLGAGTNTKSVTIKSAVGYSLKENAGELIVKPIIGEEPTDDESLWLRFFLAHPKVNFDIVANVRDQRLYKVMFVVFKNTDGEYAKFGLDAST
jgi:hypothetical protein